MPDYSLVSVDHQPDFGNVSLVPVEHDPFSGNGMTQRAQPALTQIQQPPTSNNPEDEAAMSPETYVNPFVKRTLDNLLTLPQRAIDAARVSFEHNYGSGPATMSDSDVWVDPLPTVAAETALTTMGGVGAPRVAGMAAKGFARGVAAEEAGMGSLMAGRGAAVERPGYQ